MGFKLGRKAAAMGCGEEMGGGVSDRYNLSDATLWVHLHEKPASPAFL